MVEKTLQTVNKPSRPRSTSSNSSNRSNSTNPSKSEPLSRIKQDSTTRLRPDSTGSNRIKPPSKLTEPSKVPKSATSSVKNSTKSEPTGLRKSVVSTMAKNTGKVPSSAPEPPQRTTSRLSSEKLPQRKDIPPELPKKSSRIQPPKDPTGQKQLVSAKTTSLAEKQSTKSEPQCRLKVRQKVPTATDKTVKPGSTAGNRSVETTRIRPPSFLPQKSSTGIKTGTQSEMIQPPTKLKFVSKSTRQASSEKGQPVSSIQNQSKGGLNRLQPEKTQPVQPRPAPPPPPQESTTKVVEKLNEKIAEKLPEKPKPDKKSVSQPENRLEPGSPPLPPQRTTSTSSAPSTSKEDSGIPATQSSVPAQEKREKISEKKEKSKIASKGHDYLIKHVSQNLYFYYIMTIIKLIRKKSRQSFRKFPKCLRNLLESQ